MLGPVEVLHGGARIDLGGPKQRALLAVLALEAGRVVSGNRLIDALYGEQPPQRPENSLQQLVSKLRRTLVPVGEATSVVTRTPGYLLDVDPDTVDALRFARIAATARTASERGETEVAALLLRDGLELWRGEPLADLTDEPFAHAEIVRLEELRVQRAGGPIQVDLASGSGGDVVGELRMLVDRHPYRERLRVLLMRALYAQGRQVEALQIYQDARRLLVDELGVEPGDELRRVEQAVLTQSLSLEPSQRSDSTRPDHTRPDGHRPNGHVTTDVRSTAGPRPTGLSTFLFSDLVGSTGLWERHPIDMPAALARHDALVRLAISEHDGYVFTATGDGFTAAFASELDALRAAVAIQRAMAGERWGDVGPLALRIAVHTGVAHERDGDYFGPTLNRCARLLETVEGGQIVASAATEALVADRLDDDIRLVAAGERRLRDLSRPERVFAVVVEDVASTLRPLPVLECCRSRVPSPSGVVAGRESEIAEIDGLLARSGLVTLTGPGGVGKTTLALEVTDRLIERFPDGAFLVALAEVHDPTAVLTAARVRIERRLVHLAGGR